MDHNSYGTLYPIQNMACTCIQYAKKNDLPGLLSFHQKGNPLHFTCITFAIKHNNIDMLTYLLQNDCPRDESATCGAATLGYLDILKLLHSFNYGWHPDVLEEAILSNKPECFKYAFLNGGRL